MGSASKNTDTNKSASLPVRTANDPLVSCPIVCGEYMRATGFFFRVDSLDYLVTARHNLVPTRVSIANPITGGTLAEYTSTGYHLCIDVYLHSHLGWICEQITGTTTLDTCLNQQLSPDVVALQIEFDPEEHGYRIWTPADLSEPAEEDDELMIVGFDGGSFPSGNSPYSTERYCQSIGVPRLIPFENLTKQVQNHEIPLIGWGIDLQSAGDYIGLSGAPVIGDGLVGIHTYDGDLSDEVLGHLGESHAHHVGYFRSDVLNQLSTRSP